MKIYVVVHKPELELNLKNEIYELMLVGSFNKENKKYLRDDSGENISKKNENYCELTGLYWIWKNSKDDIVGLCHYRRFLSKSTLLKSPKFYLNFNDINRDFKNNKVNMILPKKIFFKNKVLTEKSKAPNKKDMQIVKEVLLDFCPEYIKEYDVFINGNSAYLCNIMITTKELLDEYCEWLFKILFEVEKRMDKNDYILDPYRKRMFGFLSERLLNIWILHNGERLKIKEYTMINTEQSFIKRLKSLITQKIRSIK